MTTDPNEQPESMDKIEISPVPNDRGGWTVKETSTHYVDVIPMIFNDRICLTPKDVPMTYDYGWCYDKGVGAILAAHIWDPDTQAEPEGFKKRVGVKPRTAPSGEIDDH